MSFDFIWFYLIFHLIFPVTQRCTWFWHKNSKSTRTASPWSIGASEPSGRLWISGSQKKDPGDDKMTKWSSGCVKRWFSYDMIDMVGWKWWYLLALVAIFNLIYIYHYISYNILLKFGMILRASYDLKLTMNGWHSIPKTIPRVIRMQTLKRRWTNTIM
jgi:hypothetical protein